MATEPPREQAPATDAKAQRRVLITPRPNVLVLFILPPLVVGKGFKALPTTLCAATAHQVSHLCGICVVCRDAGVAFATSPEEGQTQPVEFCTVHAAIGISMGSLGHGNIKYGDHSPTLPAA